MINFRTSFAACTLLILNWSGVSAHHSFGPFYDRSQSVEIEGEITEVLWHNPHIRFTMTGTDSSGREQVWDIETNSVSIVSRRGLTPELVKVGYRVRVAGSVGKLADNALFLTNMLLPTGEEIVFSGNTPRWSQKIVGKDTRAPISDDPAGELGIFRVWTSAGRLWNNNYPLTEAARTVRADWDPVDDEPTANCAPKGMVFIMEAPYPIEFVDQGDEILLRLEEYDLVRTISMSPDAAFREQPTSLLGRSVGRWEGDTLVVETTGINYPHFDKTGIPQSQAVRNEERFSVSADGSRLEYSVIVTDPATFTEPVVMTKTWVWRPGEEVQHYDCRQWSQADSNTN